MDLNKAEGKRAAYGDQFLKGTSRPVEILQRHLLVHIIVSLLFHISAFRAHNFIPKGKV